MSYFGTLNYPGIRIVHIRDEAEPHCTGQETRFQLVGPLASARLTFLKLPSAAVREELTMHVFDEKTEFPFFDFPIFRYSRFREGLTPHGTPCVRYQIHYPGYHVSRLAHPRLSSALLQRMVIVSFSCVSHPAITNKWRENCKNLLETETTVFASSSHDPTMTIGKFSSVKHPAITKKRREKSAFPLQIARSNIVIVPSSSFACTRSQRM